MKKKPVQRQCQEWEWTRPLTPTEAAREARMAAAIPDPKQYGGWWKLLRAPWGFLTRQYVRGENVMHINLVRFVRPTEQMELPQP